jgi:hypothetical protein
MNSVTKVAIETWRSVAGGHSTLETYFRHRRRKQVRREKGPTFVQTSGKGFVVLESRTNREPRKGILLRGGCDLPSMFVSARFIREKVRGTLAIASEATPAELGSHRTDLILQGLLNIPEERLIDSTSRLGLGRRYFTDRFFTEPDFVLDQLPGSPRFPKSVVVLSVGSDLVRTVYRHREHGFLVDPGGTWLNQLNGNVMPDPEEAKWFGSKFQNAGRISVDEFSANLVKIATMLKSNLGAELIVYNTLVIDPLNPTHNYHTSPRTEMIRRREFNIALKELSARHNFHVLDVDRILKLQGVRQQVDFAHFPASQMGAIGWEAYRILAELEVV